MQTLKEAAGIAAVSSIGSAFVGVALFLLTQGLAG